MRYIKKHNKLSSSRGYIYYFEQSIRPFEKGFWQKTKRIENPKWLKSWQLKVSLNPFKLAGNELLSEVRSHGKSVLFHRSTLYFKTFYTSECESECGGSLGPLNSPCYDPDESHVSVRAVSNNWRLEFRNNILLRPKMSQYTSYISRLL